MEKAIADFIFDGNWSVSVRRGVEDIVKKVVEIVEEIVEQKLLRK